MQLLFSGNFAGIFKYEAYSDVIVDLKSVSSLWDQKVSIWCMGCVEYDMPFGSESSVFAI